MRTKIMNNGTVIGYRCNGVVISKRIGQRLPWTYVINGRREFSLTLQLATMHILQVTKTN